MSEDRRPPRGSRFLWARGYRPAVQNNAQQGQQGQQQQSSVAVRLSSQIQSSSRQHSEQHQSSVVRSSYTTASSSIRQQITRRRSSAIPIVRPPSPSSASQQSSSSVQSQLLERLIELSQNASARREAEARDAAETTGEIDQETPEVQEANELNTVLVEDSPEVAAAGQPGQTQVSTLNAAAASFVFPPAQSLVVLPSVQQVLDQRMLELYQNSALVMTHHPGRGLASIPTRLPGPEYARTAAQILAQATRITPATSTAPENHVLPPPTGNRTILPAVSGLIRLGVGHVQQVFPEGLVDNSLSQHNRLLERFGNADVVWTIYTDGRGEGRLARPDEIVPGGGDRGQNGSRVYYHFSPNRSPRNNGGHALNTVDLYLESIALTMWVTRVEMDMAHVITTYLVARPAIMSALNSGIRERQLSPLLDQITHRLREGDAPDPNRRFADHNTGAMRALRDVWQFTVKLISDGANHGVRSVELPGVHKMLKAMNHMMEYMNLLEDEMARVMQTPGAQELVDAYMATGLTVEQLREFEDVAANMPDFRPENLQLMTAVTAHFGVPLAVRLREVVVQRPTNYTFENPLPFGCPVERVSTAGDTVDNSAPTDAPSAGPERTRNSNGSRAGATAQNKAPNANPSTAVESTQARPTGTTPRERLTRDQWLREVFASAPGELGVLAAAHHREQRSGLRSNLWNGSHGPPPPNPFAPVRVDRPTDNQDEAARTVADTTPEETEMVDMVDSLLEENEEDDEQGELYTRD